jgi:hypothetical protein
MARCSDRAVAQRDPRPPDDLTAVRRAPPQTSADNQQPHDLWFDALSTPNPVDGLEVRTPGPCAVVVKIAAAGVSSAPNVAQRGIR